VALEPATTTGFYVQICAHALRRGKAAAYICFAAEGELGSVDAADADLSIMRGRYSDQDEPFWGVTEAYGCFCHSGSIVYEVEPETVITNGSGGSDSTWIRPPTIWVERWWRVVRGAAIHVQAAWRQWVATQTVQQMREQRAASWLQSMVRTYNDKRKFAFMECMVAPHIARTKAAVKLQRAYKHKRALERWKVALTLHDKWLRATKLQAIMRGCMERLALLRRSAPAAHRVLRVLKQAGLAPWSRWPLYSRCGLTFDRFLKLAELPGHQLGGELLMDDASRIIIVEPYYSAAIPEHWQEGWPKMRWGILAADRYRLATVLREARPAWKRSQRARGRWLGGLTLEARRVCATKIQATCRGFRCRFRLREHAEDTVAQTRSLMEDLGLGRYVIKFVRCGVGYEKLLFGNDGPPSGRGVREDQLGGDREWIAGKYPMAKWGLGAAERQRLLKVMPVARSKWSRFRKLIGYQAQKVKRKYAKLEAKARAIFDDIDTDRSGTIDVAEFKKLCVSLGIGMGPKQLKETFRWMDKGTAGRQTRGTADLDGVIDFSEFFSWWRQNRDGSQARGFLTGGGLSQQAVADGVMTKSVARACSTNAFAGLFHESDENGLMPDYTTRPQSPAPVRGRDGSLKLRTGVERMEAEAKKIRPVTGATQRASRNIRSGSAGSRLTRGRAAGSGTAVAFSNAATLAYMESNGRGLAWDQVDDISAPAAKWGAPHRQGYEATLAEWVGGADVERKRGLNAEGDSADDAFGRKVKVGAVVRVLWEETSRAAVERCSAIGTGWTTERAARCGHEGIVGQVDKDGTARVHFQPRPGQRGDDLDASVAQQHQEGPKVLVGLVRSL
jgi:Ca2+-binding EF-hand superfamily protein